MKYLWGGVCAHATIKAEIGFEKCAALAKSAGL
jgi:hypothetical protein